MQWLTAPGQLKTAADYGVYPMTSIASYRFFLSLRESISKTRMVRSGLFTTTAGDAYDLPERLRPRINLQRVSKHGAARNCTDEADADSL